ncbi:hypothetical protein RZS08_48295, partial [Arthrospira platensis SPKY1]|nr:hypothetical protein [Arthrospira platensis SPKY1]
QQLRAEGFLKPIIALTAHALKGEKERCLQAGMNDFTTKPIDAKRLEELIQRYMPILENEPQPSQVPPSAQKPMSSSQTPTFKSHFDRQKLLEFVLFDVDTYLHIL